MHLYIIGLPVPPGNWEECAVCAVKPGSPKLCEDCLRRRDQCHRLQYELLDEQKRQQGQLFQYFRVDLAKGTAVPYLYNLVVWRLMKAKEAKENGFGEHDKWVLVGEIKGIDARNAQCIIQMLETPRPPLQNKEEEKLWQERLAKLDSPKINLPSTVPQA